MKRQPNDVGGTQKQRTLQRIQGEIEEPCSKTGGSYFPKEKKEIASFIGPDDDMEDHLIIAVCK